MSCLRSGRISFGLLAALLGVGLFSAVVIADNEQPKAKWGVNASLSKDSEPMLAHMVFFTLKEKTPAARQKLVDACQKYLTNHPGAVYFSAGSRAEEFDRSVNDTEFDVALHVVFQDKQAHDAYQVAERHLQFIDENKETWAGVRVYDSYVK